MGDKRAGIIIRKCGTNLVLLEQGWGKSLPNNIYDIPKGHCEPGESIEEAAIREAFEEANIKVDENDLELIEISPYNSDTLAIFYCEIDFDIAKCKCSSTFENQYGKVVPEVVDYKLFDFVKDDLENSHIYKNLRKILDGIFKKLPVY